ncbi:MAG TPA: hypothetical protein VGG68_08330 [Caulobacteraceae bacterium]|jgi:hypothetical protein
MAVFSFAYNPFVILPVSVRAGAQAVEEAYQRRLAARPQDEAALSRARRLLLESDSRLAAEVAWLVDVGPKDAVTLLGAMAGGNQTALLEALANQPALSKANVAADACARTKSTAFLKPLIEAHRALDPTTLIDLINENHAAIPMALVSERQAAAAIRAITMLHAGSAMEAIGAQNDPAFAFAAVTQGPDAATGAFLDELSQQYQRRFPPEAPAAAAEEVYEVAAAPASVPGAGEPIIVPREEAHSEVPVIGGAFADLHAGDQGWGEGEQGRAAMATAFMDAQLIFSEHDRFDTWGNARRVRRVLYVLGGSLAAVVLLILVFFKGPSDSDVPANNTASTPNYALAPPPPVHAKHGQKECITVSGASYCTTQ